MKHRNSNNFSPSSLETAGTMLDGQQNKIPSDPQRLMEDLSAIARLLRNRTCAEQAKPALTALVKLVPGLDMQMWQEINTAQECEGWFALDLGSETEDGKSDRRRMDPQTGLLEVDGFHNTLRHNADQAQAVGLPVSLILLRLPAYPEAPNIVQLILRGASMRLWQSSQPQDCLGHVEPNLLGLGLTGCSSFQAVAMGESILEDLDNLSKAFGLPSGLFKIGVANLEKNGQSGSMQDRAKVLMENAVNALEQIADTTLGDVRDRVKLFRRKADAYENETLVLANEKQFLFFGG